MLFFFCSAGVIFYGMDADSKEAGNTLNGTVQDASGQMIEKAAVYLIPSTDVEALAKTPIEVKGDSPNDEPLEDSLAVNIDKYKTASTDKKGAFTIGGIQEGKYFVYVMPSDRTYLPGGDKSNRAMCSWNLTRRKS